MKVIKDNLGVGSIDIKSKSNMIAFTISSLSELNTSIIPLFDKHSIQGLKSLDYTDFCKIAKLVEEKAHLTEEGLEEIRKIKLGMNKGRLY